MRKQIWVYTSLPKDVIAEMVGPLEKEVPDADVKWYQSGSELIEGRLNQELERDQLKADLVLAGDPLWYLEAKRRDQLLPYRSSAVRNVASSWVDSDGAFATVRMSLVLLGYDPRAISAAELPERWRDLVAFKYNRKVSMANPLESPMAFIATGLLSRELGWDFFSGLHVQGLVAEGNHGSVVSRIENEERPIGILPYESILRARRAKSRVQAQFPADGAIPVPGQIAILRGTRHPQVAQEVYDWFFSPSAQQAMVHGGSYSPLPGFAPPEGAKPMSQITLKSWTPQELAKQLSERDRTRARFSAVVLH